MLNITELLNSFEVFLKDTKGIYKDSGKPRINYILEKMKKDFPKLNYHYLELSLQAVYLGDKRSKRLSQNDIDCAAKWFKENRGKEFFVPISDLNYCINKIKKDYKIPFCKIEEILGIKKNCLYQKMAKEWIDIDEYNEIIDGLIKIEDELCYN